MKELLEHPWIRVLLIATAIAMCTFALRETAWITEPIAVALKEVLMPVAVGFAIAYVVTPIVDAIARQGGVRRFVAAGMLFAVVSLVVSLTMILLVPAVIHEGSALTGRVFQGETYQDLNHNDRYDPGEPFEDSNGNKVWDRGLVASGLVRLEEWQNRIKVKAHLAFDDPSLSYLALYAAETAPYRDYLRRMIEVATAGESVERWPATPSDVEVKNPASREFGWPSPSAQSITDAGAQVAPDLRERWLTLVGAADAAQSERHAELLTALAQARLGPESGSDPLVLRVHDAWQKPLTAERRAQAQALATALDDADHQGQPGARRLIVALRGGDSSVGTQTLAALVNQLETAVKGSLHDSPTRIGDWTKAGFTNLQSWFGLLLNVILVPIYAFFLVLAMPAIRRGVHEYIPLRRRQQTIRIIRDIEQVVAAFFRGRLIICTLCSIAAGIGFFAIGVFSAVSVPYSILFALAIGFATTVPLSGILFLLPAVVMTMLQPEATALHATLVVVVYVLVQVLEAVLIPTVMGREVELHPVTLIVALLLCGKLLGILGLILAVPIAASCRILAREYLWPRLRTWANRPSSVVLVPVGPGTDDGTPLGGNAQQRERT